MFGSAAPLGSTATGSAPPPMFGSAAPERMDPWSAFEGSPSQLFGSFGGSGQQAAPKSATFAGSSLLSFESKVYCSTEPAPQQALGFSPPFSTPPPPAPLSPASFSISRPPPPPPEIFLEDRSHLQQPPPPVLSKPPAPTGLSRRGSMDQPPPLPVLAKAISRPSKEMKNSLATHLSEKRLGRLLPPEKRTNERALKQNIQDIPLPSFSPTSPSYSPTSPSFSPLSPSKSVFSEARGKLKASAPKAKEAYLKISEQQQQQPATEHFKRLSKEMRPKKCHGSVSWRTDSDQLGDRELGSTLFAQTRQATKFMPTDSYVAPTSDDHDLLNLPLGDCGGLSLYFECNELAMGALEEPQSDQYLEQEPDTVRCSRRARSSERSLSPTNARELEQLDLGLAKKHKDKAKDKEIGAVTGAVSWASCKKKLDRKRHHERFSDVHETPVPQKKFWHEAPFGIGTDFSPARVSRSVKLCTEHVTKLLRLQNMDGSWHFGKELDDLIGVNSNQCIGVLRSSGLSSLGLTAWEEIQQLLATILSLYLLLNKLFPQFCSSERPPWADVLDHLSLLSRSEGQNLLKENFQGIDAQDVTTAIINALDFLKRMDCKYPALYSRLELGTNWFNVAVNFMGPAVVAAA
ncbi:serine/arginine repetitive matrix protein 1-like isoform X2 [Elysia marginata]|uniref:Serine/arginine repetitive matrix protein 1-like isoform X2 n=1 Tax=Elysia marginata TaxID=1093978 RepID=A0AAV4F0N8_9GAST|nr:serine/arginine repetitive matrix protein 1-like isoform X2 [Elysia marginata]